VIPRDKPAVAAFYRDLGKRIAAARKDAGLTQYALALAVGVTRPSIGNIELGTQGPPLHVLLAICEAVGVALSALLDGQAAAGAAKAGAIARNAQTADCLRRRAEQARRDMRKLDDTLADLLATVSGAGAGEAP
jgi:transcriptional regulator with XRE-family HTH domain